MTHEATEGNPNKSMTQEAGYEDRLPKPPSRPSYTSHMSRTSNNLDPFDYGLASDQSRKENIFRRPSKTKIMNETPPMYSVYRKRKENVEPPCNFFDNTYRQPIMSNFLKRTIIYQVYWRWF
jgi:hypothetical protein